MYFLQQHSCGLSARNYSLSDCHSGFNFFLLHQLYLENKPVIEISRMLGISYQLIYAYLRAFAKFLDSLLVTLRFLECFIPNSKPTTLLQIIRQHFTPQNFCYQYFVNSKWFLFMSKFHNKIPCPIHLGIGLSPPT
jgi:hypothetical protein